MYLHVMITSNQMCYFLGANIHVCR